MTADYHRLAEQAATLIRQAPGFTEAMEGLCRLLAQEVPHYHWVGFYLPDPDTPRTLVLGPYMGAATEHTRIPYGRGVCGQVAVSGQTKLVDDVTSEENYLSCSMDVRSELVAPLVWQGCFLGQIDIDSHDPAAFTPADQALVEGLCRLLAATFPTPNDRRRSP